MNKNKNKVVLVIEAGHRKNTPGKCSPDRVFKEWEWNEDCKNIIIRTLAAHGWRVFDATPKGDDDSLASRVQTVNRICSEHGRDNVIYISVHCNASGSGESWMKARRWSVWTSRGNTKSDDLAECLYEAAYAKWGINAVRSDLSDGDHDYESDFYVLKKSACTACLIENFFYDNKDDLEYLLSPQSIYDCAEVAVSGLEKYIETL